MYCSHQYLSIEPKKPHAHINAHRPPTNLKIIVSMNADISETIKDRELGSQISIP